MRSITVFPRVARPTSPIARRAIPAAPRASLGASPAPSPRGSLAIALALVLPVSLGVGACTSAPAEAPRTPRAEALPEPATHDDAPSAEPAGAPGSAPAQVEVPVEAPASAPPTAATAASAPAQAEKRPEPPPIPKSTAVLHVGDSMVESGLAQALRPRMRALGVRYEVRGEQSTFTQTWAGRMDELVAATQPDLVIITLGGNEIGNTRPESSARFVKRIVNATKGRPCVWMTAPLWREETGIYDVIQKNAAPCRFFETDRFLTEPIERRGDKIHPTPKGGELWAGIFWEWLMTERTGATKPWELRPGPESEYAPRGLRTAPVFPKPGGPTASR